MLLWEIDRPLFELAEIYGFERAAARLSGQPGGGHRIEIAGAPARHRLRPARQEFTLSVCRRHGRANCSKSTSFGGARACPANFSIMRHCSTPSASRARRRSFRRALPIPIHRTWRADCSARGDAAAPGCSKARRWRSTRRAARSASRSTAAGRSRRNRWCWRPATSCLTSSGPSVHRISSSWAIATRPQPENIWKDGALIWEAQRGLSLCPDHAGRTDHPRRRGQRRDRRAGGARPADPGEVARAGREARRAVAAREDRHRIPLGRHLRHHQRRLAVDRPGARRERRLRGIWLWRQRHHLQFPGRAS